MLFGGKKNNVSSLYFSTDTPHSDGGSESMYRDINSRDEQIEE